MERKGIKISVETKVECAKLVASGKIGATSLAHQIGVAPKRVRYWTALYKEHGETAFINMGINKVYPMDLKLEAVKDYIAGMTDRYALFMYDKLFVPAGWNLRN